MTTNSFLETTRPSPLSARGGCAALAALGLAACASAPPTASRPSRSESAPPVSLAAGLSPLKEWFARQAGKPRAVALLSST